MRHRFLACHALGAAVFLSTSCGGKAVDREPDPSWGAPCAAGEICEGGTLCLDDPRFPGGYCTNFCDDAVCGDGARCASVIGSRFCLADCTNDGDCRPEYSCWLGGCRPPCEADADCGTAGGVCMRGRCTGPECAADSECGAGLVCIDGRCSSPPPDGGGMTPNGAPCTRSVECVSGICLPPDLGGICAGACDDRLDCIDFAIACVPVPRDADDDGTAERASTACVAGNESGIFLGGRCGTSAECEARLCLDGECAEACDDDTDCLAGQVCTTRVLPGPTDGTFRGCGYADTGPVYDIDLGMGRASTGLPSPRINFAVPPDAVSVTLIGQQPPGMELLPLTYVDVFAPDGAHIYSFSDLASWIDPPERWVPIDSEEVIAMLIPNTTPERLGFVTGRYGYTVAALARMEGDSASTDLVMRARVKRGNVDAGRQTLDLNVFLVGIGLTADAARTHTRLQNALAELNTILGGGGVQLGTIDYIQITGTDATQFSVIDSSDGPSSEMSRLLRLSGSRTNDALDLFLVRGISEGAGEGGIALGIAGGIPGPPGVHGTIHSGVLVSFDPMVVGTDHRVVAQIAAHEIGHFLGLFHNRENARPCRAGTGPTPSDPCAPFGGGDVLADTDPADGTNLMWFALGGADGRTYNVDLSAGQGHVLRRNPLTH